MKQDLARWLYGDSLPVSCVSDLRIWTGEPVVYENSKVRPFCLDKPEENKKLFLGICLRGGPPGQDLRIGTAGVYWFNCPEVSFPLGQMLTFTSDLMWPTGNCLVAIGRAIHADARKVRGEFLVNIQIQSSILGPI